MGKVERADTTVTLMATVTLVAREANEDNTELYLVSKIPVAVKLSVTMISTTVLRW